MRRLWAAGAAMVVCLTLGGLPALSQEAGPSASLPPPETVPTPDGSSMLNLEVTIWSGWRGWN